jgi:hypothetical protein
MDLGSIQPVTEMSTRILPGVKGGQRVRLTTSPPFVSRFSIKCGSSTSHKPMAFHGLFTAIVLPFTLHKLGTLDGKNIRWWQKLGRDWQWVSKHFPFFLSVMHISFLSKSTIIKIHAGMCKVNAKLSLCLINKTLYYEDIWGSGGIAPSLLTSVLLYSPPRRIVPVTQ